MADPTRRAVLTGGVAAVVAGGAVGYAGRTAQEALSESSQNLDRTAVADSGAVGNSSEPFYGSRQAGVITAPQANAAFLAFDLAKGITRAEVMGVLRAWTEDSARLSSGVSGLADLEPELAAEPARLTVTVGLGPSFFDVIGMPAQRPEWLRPLPAFPQIDKLENKWSGGDLLLQICADDPVIVSHAARVLGAGVRGKANLRWAQRGFRKAVGTDPSGRTQRNLFGQVDGTVNPGEGDSDFDQLLYSDGSDKKWMRDGTSLVIRRIAMNLDDWEQIDRPSRELSIGRTLDNGAPLTGKNELDAADFSAVDDNSGLSVIPPESHMARAVQRNRDEVILRRPYNYDDVPEAGKLNNAGLIFASFQADPVRQFLPIQKRLAEKDSLNTWITPIGSAVFAIPPGVQDGEFIGQGIFEGQQ